MRPVLFQIPVPHFLQGFLPPHLQVYSYGFCIAVGIILAYYYTLYQSKKQFGANSDTITTLLLWIVAAAFIGGKLFFYLEDPKHYFSSLETMIGSIRSGFTFYGSLLLAIPVMIWYFRKKKLPVLGMLDIMAVTACIVHACGRVGCFMAGCCHGLPTESFLGVTFSDPMCSANPLHTPLYPTQLFDVFMLVVIVIVISFWKKYKKFDGQMFLVYLILYAIGRSVIENYRGDSERGFLFNGLVSHSQFIAFWVIIGTLTTWMILLKKSKKQVENLGADEPTEENQQDSL